MKTALTFAGDVIFDLGYGVDGRKAAQLISGSFTADSEGTRLRLLMVVNTTRPLTSSVPLILAYLQEFGAVDGLINNTHLGAKQRWK